MDASLDTQSDSGSLAMRAIDIFSDGSGGSCNLEITSLPFTASISFFFDFPTLPEFVDNLILLEKTLSGEAKLGQNYEEAYICLQGNGRGAIRVSGLLAVYSEHTQELRFSFKTDQTALGKFIADLKEIIRANAT